MEQVQASWNKAAKGRPSGWDRPGPQEASAPALGLNSRLEHSRPPSASPAPGLVAARLVPASSPLPPRAAALPPRASALPHPERSAAGHRCCCVSGSRDAGSMHPEWDCSLCPNLQSMGTSARHAGLLAPVSYEQHTTHSA